MANSFPRPLAHPGYTCTARGEVDEMNYLDRAPRRPPYIRLDGEACTLFAVRGKALDGKLFAWSFV